MVRIQLDTVDKVKRFIGISTKQDFDINVMDSNERYCVDGKSIMGLFSLNLSKPLICHLPNEEDERIFADAVKDFRV